MIYIKFKLSDCFYILYTNDETYVMLSFKVTPIFKADIVRLPSNGVAAAWWSSKENLF